MKELTLPGTLRRFAPAGRLIACMALTLLLTACRLGGYAPLSLALTALAGPGLPGLAGLAGAGLGALVFLDFQSGLRHTAAAILIFAASSAFFDTKFYRRPGFRPAVSAGMFLLVQSVYLLHRLAAEVMACFAAAALLAGCVWYGLRETEGEKRRPAAFLLLAALSIALCGAAKGGKFDFGCAFAALALLFAATESAPGLAAALGAGLGLALDLTGEPPQLLLTALCGAGCGLAACCRERRWQMALALCAPFACLPALFDADDPLLLLGESAVGAALFLLLPERLLKAAPREKKAARAEKAAVPAFAAQSAQAAQGAAFRDLYDSFFRGTSPPPPENPSVIFDRAAERVCRRCVLRTACWQQNYNATYNAFNDACPAMLRRGRAETRDFPLYFTSRCVHLTEFLAAVDAQLRDYLLRRQYHQRLQAVRAQARDQYAQMGDLLSGAAQPASAPAATPLGYRIGSGLRPREGQRVCGDQLAIFEVGSTLYLLLSDGMGTGEPAHREAAMTVRLLREFLEAGIEPVSALRTLNAALMLRGEEGGGFTTIDLLALQRPTGAGTLYKYGAAPSYLKRGGCVTRVTGQSLPAGLQQGADGPESTRLSLPAGSFFVMVSDGVADETDDEWLQNLMAGWSGQSAEALASLILSESRTRRGLRDDCAVLVLHLPKMEDSPPRQV